MTVADTKHWKILISSIAKQEIEDKVDTTLLEIPINQTIQIAKYGKGVNEILCTIIAVTGSKIHRPYLEFDATSQSIDIALSLPYSITEKITASDTLAIMQHTFLIGILQMKTLEGIEDFDFDGLYKDVKEVFFPKTTTPTE